MCLKCPESRARTVSDSYPRVNACDRDDNYEALKEEFKSKFGKFAFFLQIS